MLGLNITPKHMQYFSNFENNNQDVLVMIFKKEKHLYHVRNLLIHVYNRGYLSYVPGANSSNMVLLMSSAQYISQF